MLTISPIKNVNNTINNISFKAGVRTNVGADVINNTADINHEGSFLTDFLGSIRQSRVFYEALFKRQESIEKGLEAEQNKINAIA